MTGNQFRQAIKNDARKVEALAKLMGITRAHLYRIFGSRKVPEKFILRARAAGIVFPHEKIEMLVQKVQELESENVQLKKQITLINRQRRPIKGRKRAVHSA